MTYDAELPQFPESGDPMPFPESLDEFADPDELVEP